MIQQKFTIVWSLWVALFTHYLKEKRKALRTEIVQWKQELCSSRPSSCRTRASEPCWGEGTRQKPSRMGVLASADDTLRFCLFLKESTTFCLSQISLPIDFLSIFTSSFSVHFVSLCHSSTLSASLSFFINLGLQAESCPLLPPWLL